MSLSLVFFLKVCFFALKVNIYLLNMSIQCAFSLFFVCSLSPSIINYACPSFRTTFVHAQCTALIFTLQHEFEFSMLPSIPSNVMLVAYVNSCFIIIRQNFIPVSSFSSGISYDRMQVFYRQTFLSYRQEFMFDMCFHENKRELMDFFFKKLDN